MKNIKTIFISAGELSGELLAVDLVLALKSLLPDCQFIGLGGDVLERANVKIIEHYDKFSVNGFAQVLGKIAEICMAEKQLLAKIDHYQVDAAILVDFPGLHFHMASALRVRRIPVIQYIAPKVWAWGRKRIKNLREDFDLVLGIFPFEEKFFNEYHLPFHYVGCPLIDRVRKIDIKRSDLGFFDNKPLITILPGSRESEIKCILPVLCEIVDEINKLDENTQFALPIAANLDPSFVIDYIQPELRKKINIFHGNSLELMKASDACIVTSGTATLECALLQTPMVVTYRMDDASFFLAKSKVKIEWISLVNIILQRSVVAEYIQDIPIREVAKEVCRLACDKDYNLQAKSKLAELFLHLEGDAAQKAANIIKNHLTKA